MSKTKLLTISKIVLALYAIAVSTIIIINTFVEPPIGDLVMAIVIGAACVTSLMMAMAANIRKSKPVTNPGIGLIGAAVIAILSTIGALINGSPKPLMMLGILWIIALMAYLGEKFSTPKIGDKAIPQESP